VKKILIVTAVILLLVTASGCLTNDIVEQSEQFNDPSDNKTAEISVGSVSLVVGEKEYEAHTQVVFGRNNGISFDALTEQPQEIAGKLEKIVFEEGMQLVIDGGNRWGDRTFLLYRLIDGEWSSVYERQEGLAFGVETVYEDPPGFPDTPVEAGDYILGIRLAWQNGLEGADLKYTGYLYSFRLIVGEAPSSLSMLFP